MAATDFRLSGSGTQRLTDLIDLRSDTVTQPTPAMRRAMAEAEVGDDVYGEDPTVNALQAEAARRLGKEAALFVASGTMGNLLALLSYCDAGDEVLVGDQAHIFQREVGAAARLAGLMVSTLPNDSDGGIDPERIRAAVRGSDLHEPRTSLLALENTHNYLGGTALTLDRTRVMTDVAQETGLRIHLDGARIFNAELALGVPAAQLAEGCDSVGFCLSKGLAAPVGSLLCGDATFVERARKYRKMLGGGMRQAGVLAAAGLVGLVEMVPRLADDHANARRLARGLAELGLEVDIERVETNIVVAPVAGGDGAAFQQALAERGVLATVISGGRARFVTHYGIEEEDIDEALDRVKAVLPLSLAKAAAE